MMSVASYRCEDPLPRPRPWAGRRRRRRAGPGRPPRVSPRCRSPMAMPRCARRRGREVVHRRPRSSRRSDPRDRSAATRRPSGRVHAPEDGRPIGGVRERCFVEAGEVHPRCRGLVGWQTEPAGRWRRRWAGSSPEITLRSTPCRGDLLEGVACVGAQLFEEGQQRDGHQIVRQPGLAVAVAQIEPVVAPARRAAHARRRPRWRSRARGAPPHRGRPRADCRGAPSTNTEEGGVASSAAENR